MRIPDPIANTTTEAYLAYKAGVLSEGDLKPKLYDPYIHLDAWLAYWAGLTLDYPVKNVGKNLFNKNSVSTGYLNADGTLSSDVAYKTSDFIAVKPNTAYSKTYTASPRTKYYNSTRQPLNTTTYQDISIGGAAGTFTTPANAAYVRFSFPVAGINLDTTQLELGSAVTAYEPYSGEPEMLTDEEALIAYLSGVTNTYPEEFRDPADVRVAAYLKYLVSARWGRPEYPVTNEELYLSMMDAPYIPAGEPSSDIEIDDTAEAPFKDVKMYGDTSQTTYTGKNLLPNQLNSHSTGGITMVKNADGSMTFNGKTTASAVYFNLNQSESGHVYLESGETYTLSASSPMPSNTRLCCRNVTGATTNYIDIYGGGQTSKTATMAVSDDTFTYFAVYNEGTEVNNLTIYPMLEKSATATPYEPYVGGVPAPNPDYPQAVRTVTGENVVKIRGKNLNEWENVAWSSSTTTSSWCFQNGATGAYGANITSLTKYKITLPAGTYTAKVYDLSSNIINIQVCADGTPNEIVVTSPSSINSSNLSSTITLAEATTVVVRYRTTNPSLGIGNTKLQIEKGSATAYEPYQEQSYPISLGSIELCQIGDYIDKLFKNVPESEYYNSALTEGAWYVRKEVGKYTFTGNETVGKAGNASNNSFYYASSQNVGTFGFSDIDTSNMGTGAASTVVLAVWSDRFLPAATASVITTDTIGIAFNKTNSGVDCRLGFGLSSSVNTAQLLTSWLTNNAPSVYYPLATPTDTAITNSALIDQLNALKNGGSYTGTTYIRLSATDPNLPGLLKVEAYKYD